MHILQINGYLTPSLFSVYLCTRRYDRNKILLKEVHNVQYVSCMNPTAGSFTVNPRLQVHSHTHARTHADSPKNPYRE